MTQRRLALVFLSALAIALVLLAAVFSYEKLPWRHKRADEEGLICHVEQTLMSLAGGGREESLECDVLSLTKDTMLLDMSITIDLPSDFVSENRKALDAGLLYVHIPGGHVVEEKIKGFGSVGTSVHIPPGSNLSVLDSTEVGSKHHQRRRHRRTFEERRDLEGTGVRTVMVFRVTTDDASPEIGATEIDERMFNPRAFSFASQFDKCSFGQLTFEPYDAYTPVIELYVPGEVSSFTERTILNAATRRAGEAFGKDIFDRMDHAVFCMPDGTSGKPYIAYSGVGSFFSVYHNLRCSYPTTVMHEIAHNCGLGHAFEDGQEYGDETTIMGFSSSSKTGPSKCFNGQNIWHFGWFKDRSTMIDPFQGHQLLELAPFVDFDKTNLYQAVLITVFDMHIVYNRAKSFNAETSEYQNKVTIVKEENFINSALLAVLDVDSPTYTIEDILGSGRTLYVQLCDSVVGVWEADFYTISIGLDYSVCPLPPPTPSPTHKPTYAPTIPPSTPLPSHQPSPGPTPLPTPWPTPYPTLQPLWPTPNPTSQPTPWPTPFPTNDAPKTEITVSQSISPTSELPNIIIASPDRDSSPPTDDPGDLIVVHHEETTQNPVEESDRPPITDSSLKPPRKPIALRDESKAEGSAASMKEGPQTIPAILIASLLAVFVTCCLCSCLRWNQRRLEEQKRNLRLLQYNSSSQVKIYMQDPV